MRLNRRCPLVSVVVIFRNEERFLAEAVESVIAQTYDDWELILVDDGSSDSSSGIAREFVRAHPERIRYLEHPGHAGRGLSPSRNLGLRAANGELIALLDADDVWLPNKLAEQVQILADHPTVGMVYGATEYWFGWTGRAEDAARDFVRPLGVEAESVLRPPQLLELMIPRIVPSPGPSGVIVRRELAERVGFFEDEFTGLYDDQVFLAKLSLAGEVFASQRCWYRYRQHPTSFYAQAKRAGARTAGRRKYLRWLDRYLVRQGYSEAPIRAVAAEEMRKLRLPLAQRIAASGSRRAPRASSFVRRIYERLPLTARERAATLVRARSYLPPSGGVQLGDLRRLTPISRKAGEDRGGTAVSRFYIDRFLETHQRDLHGRILEVGNGSCSFLSDALGVTRPVSPRPPTTRVSVVQVRSLSAAHDDPYDCAVLTDLHRARNPAAVLEAILALLRPGGVVLATLPGIAQLARHRFDPADDLWRFTERSARDLFSELGSTCLEVATHGNVLAATAQLHGIAANELTPTELAYHDPDYPVVITVRAYRAEPVRQLASPAGEGVDAPGDAPARAATARRHR